MQLSQFYTQNKGLLEVTAFIATISGLFLNIDVKDNTAQFLNSINIFLLISLFTCIVSLFVRFNKFIWSYSKKWESELGSPVALFATITSVIISLYVVSNLLGYLTAQFPESVVVLTFALVLSALVLPVYVDYKFNFSRIVSALLYALSLSGLLTLLVIYVQFLVFKQLYLVFIGNTFIAAYIIFFALFSSLVIGRNHIEIWTKKS